MNYFSYSPQVNLTIRLRYIKININLTKFDYSCFRIVFCIKRILCLCHLFVSFKWLDLSASNDMTNPTFQSQWISI